jgi:hypothetical protein
VEGHPLKIFACFCPGAENKIPTHFMHVSTNPAHAKKVVQRHSTQTSKHENTYTKQRDGSQSVDSSGCTRRYYLPFAESAIRYFFALGFVPWRLRKISTGDVVPEVIPLGMFTWSIESITNRNARKGRQNLHKQHAQGGSEQNSRNFNKNGSLNRSTDPRASRGAMHREVEDMHQKAAERAFQKQKNYFSDPKKVPYPLQGDLARMPTRREDTDIGKKDRLQGYAESMRNSLGQNNDRVDDDGTEGQKNILEKRRRLEMHTPAFNRQQVALQRQAVPHDDDETKVLRYCISFTENCGVSEDDVEMYEYIAPTNSITRLSVLYGTVPTPLSHLLIDYRNIRTTQIRQAYADSYNTQAKLICSYNAVKNMYNLSEGNPILNSEGWGPQQRLGLNTDSNLPSEIEANAYTRDAVAENLMSTKPAEHKPLIYTLPKNTSLEAQHKLESIIDIAKLQVKIVWSCMCVYVCVCVLSRVSFFACFVCAWM